LPTSLYAQHRDSSLLIKDSLKYLFVKHKHELRNKEDSLKLKDSLQFVNSRKADSIQFKKDSLIYLANVYKTTLNNFLKDNIFLNSAGKSFAFVTTFKKQTYQDETFYAFLILVATLTFLRFFYLRYSNNLFQVFFNTSLRQSQLTDQLLQAKLPSLFFNIISFISGGYFIYFILKYYGWLTTHNPTSAFIICVITIAIIYFVKFISLKFIGWVTGFEEITNTYIFVIFLINKILGILLIPLLIIMAFSYPDLIKVSLVIAILLTVLMFIMRFYRSYGLLQNQLKFNRLHFYMYIIGIEIIPVLLIYMGLGTFIK